MSSASLLVHMTEVITHLEDKATVGNVCVSIILPGCRAVLRQSRINM